MIRRKSKAKEAFDAEYALAREQVLRRDEWCKICGRQAGHVHHIRPRSMGGKNDLDNLVLLCNLCHTRVHENVSWAKQEGWIK